MKTKAHLTNLRDTAKAAPTGNCDNMTNQSDRK